MATNEEFPVISGLFPDFWLFPVHFRQWKQKWFQMEEQQLIWEIRQSSGRLKQSPLNVEDFQLKEIRLFPKKKRR